MNVFESLILSEFNRFCEFVRFFCSDFNSSSEVKIFCKRTSVFPEERLLVSEFKLEKSPESYREEISFAVNVEFDEIKLERIFELLSELVSIGESFLVEFTVSYVFVLFE